MSALGRLTASVVSGTVDTTVALASFNFDFSLYKVEAPKEFAGLGSQLSTGRRLEAESGNIPQLIKAYGLRASEISKSTTTNPHGNASHGVFASRVGADATSIWAAATSGKAAIAAHLLACMLARIWEAPEATSIWVEITSKRKAAIANDFEQDNMVDLGIMTAAKETFTRSELADWDASARAWLRVADVVKARQQTQLRLIIDNIQLPVNHMLGVYDSVINAWKSSLKQMENLILNIPQQVHSGDILLSLSAWHLYPDLVVLEAAPTEIRQDDPIFGPRSILTIGLERSQAQRESGVYWSLPLAHLRYYGTPITTARSISSGERSRISMNELLQAFLSSYLRKWDTGGTTTEVALTLFSEVADEFANTLSSGYNRKITFNKEQSWLALLSAAAKRHLRASGQELKVAMKLRNLGRTYGS